MAGGNDAALETGPTESGSGGTANGSSMIRRLWRRKWFTLAGTIIPALIAGIISFSEPQNTSMTYSFSIQQDQQDYRVLKDRFYSKGNALRLAGAFERAGLDALATALTDEGRRRLERLVQFHAFPGFFEKEFVPVPGRLDDLENLDDIRSPLLELCVTVSPDDPLEQIGAVVKDNFCSVLPLMTVERELRGKIASLGADLSRRKESRFGLMLELDRMRAVAAVFSVCIEFSLGKRRHPNVASEDAAEFLQTQLRLFL